MRVDFLPPPRRLVPYNSRRMDEPDVFDGAMRIARVEYPEVDPAFYRALLDDFAKSTFSGYVMPHLSSPKGR